jgi:hypothetical protein
MLRPDPVDGAIRHVADQDVIWVSHGRQNRLRIFEERRMPIVRVASKETVEVLKAQPSCPLVKRAVRALQPVGDQMMFAKPRRVVTIVDKNVADCTGALRKDGIIARIPRGKLRDVAKADTVMVAAREKRGPRGRAQRRGVKVVVPKAACCHAIQDRGWNRPSAIFLYISRAGFGDLGDPRQPCLTRVGIQFSL